jgi:hypothetical protein
VIILCVSIFAPDLLFISDVVNEDNKNIYFGVGGALDTCFYIKMLMGSFGGPQAVPGGAKPNCYKSQ